MSRIEVVVTVRKSEPDGSYTEYQTKPNLSAFSAKARKEILQVLESMK